jgi:hypothetical protein
MVPNHLLGRKRLPPKEVPEGYPLLRIGDQQNGGRPDEKHTRRGVKYSISNAATSSGRPCRQQRRQQWRSNKKKANRELTKSDASRPVTAARPSGVPLPYNSPATYRKQSLYIGDI